jgi:hypothetical protein
MGAGGLLMFVSTFAQRAVLAVQLLGVTIIAFGAFLFYAAVRVRGWKEFAIRIAEKEVQFPARPLAQHRFDTVPLVSIEKISYAASGQGPRLEILSHHHFHILPFSWFPDGAEPAWLALRLHVRSQLARANQDLEPGELAALEQTMLDGKSFGAYVVETLDAPPEVVATLDAPAEQDDEALRAKVKGRGAKLYDCSVRIRALRDALERGLAAPLMGKSPQISAPASKSE